MLREQLSGSKSSRKRVAKKKEILPIIFLSKTIWSVLVSYGFFWSVLSGFVQFWSVLAGGILGKSFKNNYLIKNRN